jgi:transposase
VNLYPLPDPELLVEVRRKRMLQVEDWAEIRRLHRAERMPIKAIARVMGRSKNTVEAELASTAPSRYRRASKGSAVDVVEPRIRELLREYRGCRPQ